MQKLKIVILCLPGTLCMDTATFSDAFLLANSLTQQDDTLLTQPEYELVYASPTRNKIQRSASGLMFACTEALDEVVGKIDTLFIGGLSMPQQHTTHSELISWLQVNASRVRRICVSGTGAELLAAKGFIRKPGFTIHWSLAEKDVFQDSGLAFNTQSLFVRHGNLISCAGMSAVIDLSLMLIEEDLGRFVAMSVAKMMLIYERRPGSESQLSTLLDQQSSTKKQIIAVQSWIKGNLGQSLKIAVLADRVAMSPRNFARVFLTQTGLPPGKYIEKLRLESSKRLLEETDLSIEQIAAQCGFGHADTLRKLYIRMFELTPYSYRKLYLKGSLNLKAPKTAILKNPVPMLLSQQNRLLA